jgi:hypothetical protein
LTSAGLPRFGRASEPTGVEWSGGITPESVEACLSAGAFGCALECVFAADDRRAGHVLLGITREGESPQSAST